jgi:hypothetical protein
MWWNRSVVRVGRPAALRAFGALFKGCCDWAVVGMALGAVAAWAAASSPMKPPVAKAVTIRVAMSFLMRFIRFPPFGFLLRIAVQAACLRIC